MPNQEQIEGKWRTFLLWFGQNVIIPLVPLLIAAFVDALIRVPPHWASSETVLIYTFLLPVVYLEKSRSPFGTMFFWLTSVAGVILYTVAHLLTHVAPTLDTGVIFKVALALDVIYIVVASAYEAVRIYRSDRMVR